MPLVPCNHCGKPVNKKPSQIEKHKTHFCNRECKDAFFNTQVEIVCAVCGKKKMRKKGRVLETNYCSLKCAGKAECQVETNCTYCGKVIKKPKNTMEIYDKHFCNRSCKGKWAKSTTEAIQDVIIE